MAHTLDDCNLSLRLSRSEYDERLQNLQHRLRAIELAFRQQGLRGCIIFEGWDAAGKGGAIRRMVSRMDPRGFQVWPIAAPKPQDHGRYFLERFWDRLPEPGVIAIFDRSWYGRVMVERVEGFASKKEWSRSYDEINHFEAMLTSDEVRIVKLFLHVSPKEQAKRFAARLQDPWKRWKLTEEDFRNSGKRKAYVTAINDMLAKTSTEVAPWYVISAEQKRYAHVTSIATVAEVLGHKLDLSPPTLAPEVEALAKKFLNKI